MMEVQITGMRLITRFPPARFGRWLSTEEAGTLYENAGRIVGDGGAGRVWAVAEGGDARIEGWATLRLHGDFTPMRVLREEAHALLVALGPWEHAPVLPDEYFKTVTFIGGYDLEVEVEGVWAGTPWDARQLEFTLTLMEKRERESA